MGKTCFVPAAPKFGGFFPFQVAGKIRLSDCRATSSFHYPGARNGYFSFRKTGKFH
jgi:hypothetical protein